MHQHNITTPILLALTILNFAFAVPILIIREQEIPRAQGAVTVRVPAAKDAVALLVKRPYEVLPGTWGTPKWPIPGPESSSPGHVVMTRPRDTAVEAHEPQSAAAWRESSKKIVDIDSEQKKAAMLIIGVGLFATTVTGLVLPHILNNGGSNSKS